MTQYEDARCGPAFRVLQAQEVTVTAEGTVSGVIQTQAVRNVDKLCNNTVLNGCTFGAAERLQHESVSEQDPGQCL